MKDILDSLSQEYPNCNVYLYGSHVYGTQNEKSDMDFIIVGTATEYSFVKENLGDIHCLPWEKFIQKINEMEISILECLFLDPSLKRESKQIQFNIDLPLLRSSCSAKASNSWVKTKKKLEVENEPYIGQKSLFHSLRILTFALSIAKTGKIDFNQASLWQEVQSIDLNWQALNSHFKPKYNALKSELRKVIPS